MRTTYGPEADAPYFYLKKGIREVTTARVTEDVAIDPDPGEEPVGIEVLAASKHLGVTP